MSENERIHDRQPEHPNHAGQHSIRRRLESAMGKMAMWRQERIQASEGGHQMPESPYLPDGEGTEIVLFEASKRPTYQVREIEMAPRSK